MRKTWCARGILVCALLAATSAWAEPPLGFRLAAQSSHFLFYSRHGEPIDVHEVESSLSRVQQLLGQKLPGKAEYYRYGTPQEVAANVGEYASGVTFGGLRQIHTTRKSHLHEIVHLVAAHLGDPGSFFNEGLAIALASVEGGSVRVPRRVRLPAALRKTTMSALAERFDALDPAVAYPLAGSFVGYLVRVYGVPRMAAFFRASGYSGVPRASAFQATFGVTLDEAGVSWAGGRGPTVASTRTPPTDRSASAP
jgi:hypothetical protein